MWIADAECAGADPRAFDATRFPEALAARGVPQVDAILPVYAQNSCFAPLRAGNGGRPGMSAASELSANAGMRRVLLQPASLLASCSATGIGFAGTTRPGGTRATRMRYPAWTGSEPCAQTDPELFFADHPSTMQLLAPVLRRICAFCPSRKPCGEWAILYEVHGFWGGMTPHERATIRGTRKIRAAVRRTLGEETEHEPDDDGDREPRE